MPKKSQTRARSRWITDAAVPSFVLQLAVSTVGAVLTATLVVMLPAVLLTIITRNNSTGNFGDHLVAQPILILLNEPYFALPVAAAFSLGTLSHRFFRSSSLGAWIWIVPMIILLGSIATWKSDGTRPYWRDVWNNYFSSQCGNSECAYEWLVTAPFYTSLAYATGWISRNLTRQRASHDDL